MRRRSLVLNNLFELRLIHPVQHLNVTEQLTKQTFWPIERA